MWKFSIVPLVLVMVVWIAIDAEEKLQNNSWIVWSVGKL